MKRIKFIHILLGGVKILFFLPIFLFGQEILPGIFQTEQYLPLLKNKNVGIVVNQSSVFKQTHLLDSLRTLGVGVKKIFVLEHGFRGQLSAGQWIENDIDSLTGLAIISLYGKNKKPKAEFFQDLDIVVFDMQDVGVRFYTYISSLYYILQTCAETNTDILVLDRPNPNIFYVDGPILEPALKSFVGLLPIPLVYGMTIGELAQMIVGEKWHLKQEQADSNHYFKLKVIACENYTRSSLYVLPIAPSPNLKTQRAIYAYPSLALFEGTVVSEGRGTDFPFEIFGYPEAQSIKKWGNFMFRPRELAWAKNPKFKNQLCQGFKLEDTFVPQKNTKIQWKYLQMAYENYRDTASFFLKNNFFDQLTGNKELRKAILQKKNIDSLAQTWQADIELFVQERKKYLIYPD